MPLAAGQRLGHYEIVALIGVGGMGEVYRARDPRLDRTVAIKVLPRDQSERSHRLQRFELEGRVISSLNHPHICSLFDIGDEAGLRYLVMEYLEGETLHERLKRGPFLLQDALAVAIQIGEALDHAHHHGIVHRDLNPSNIMLLGPRGMNAKLLDFGLAKLMERSTSKSSSELTSVPTQTHLTDEGTIVGTYQYMSPEQLDGKEAGTRTDIFAFGAVLYEMVSGHKAFGGSSRASIISAIVKDDPPPVSKHQPMSPPALDRMIRKCLAKDPEERWQSARDSVDELKWICEGGSQAGTPPVVIARRRSRARIEWMLALLLLAVLAVVLFVSFTRSSVNPQSTPIRFEVSLPAGMFLGQFDYPEISPDASRVVFPAQTDRGSRLMLRKLDSLDLEPLPGTEGAMFPFWSPDSRWVAFFANGKLKKVDIAGGTPVAICDAQGGIGGAWNRDGVIVFCPRLDSSLQRVDASGGVPVQVTRLDSAHYQTSQFFPSFLGDERHFVFYGVSAGHDREFNGPYVGSLDSPESTQLFKTMGKAVSSKPGLLLYPIGDSLMAQTLDERSLRPAGGPRLVVERVGALGLVLGSAYSAAGATFAYRAAAPWPTLSWINRKGETLQKPMDQGDFGNPALSPDGKTLAIDFRESPTHSRDIWLLDIAGGGKNRLTFDAADHFNPTWSQDRKYIAYTSTSKGVPDIYRRPVGGGPEELLFESAQEKYVEDWSRDGRYLLFNTRVPGHGIEIWALPIGDRKPFRVVSAASNCEQGQFSPDARWIAYRCGESGRSEIFVQDFPAGSAKWQISNGDSLEPQWRDDGKELFYRQDRKMMAVDVRASGGQLRPGVPHALFEASIAGSGRSSYAPSSDGQKFLVELAPAEKASTSFTILSGWPSGLSH